jgi:hypothetical protein
MMKRKVLQVANAFSRKLIDEGAEAIVLFGSWVRGDAYKESDVDIHIVGPRTYNTLERYQGFLVSVSWATQKQHLNAFKDPSQVCGIILAWQSALIIYDPKGIAKAMKQKAKRWKWVHMNKYADEWVAKELTGYSEEVHRLVGSLLLGRKSIASVVRSLLAIHMAPILAVHHRIFYETENQLWDLVSLKMGNEWKQAQSISLGEGGESFEDTCKAALKLFSLTAHEVKSLLNPKQYEVVFHACEIASLILTNKE